MPPRKTTAEKQASGNPGNRPMTSSGNAGFACDYDFRKPVSGLDAHGRRRWSQIVQAMPPGVLVDADVGILENLCRCYSIIRIAEREIKLHGLIIESANRAGTVRKQNPACVQLMAALRQYQQTLAQLGLTPIHRNQLDSPIVYNPPGDDDADLLDKLAE